MQSAARIESPPAAATPRRTPLAGLLWAAGPFLLYAVVLRYLWFDAPIWDDYDAILDSVARLMDASSPGQWWAILVAQHNEHRIAVMRFVAWAMATATGMIDIRMLVAIGNLAVVGILVLAWAEFRHVVAPPLFAAAGFLMFQWSYYEAALMGSAALPNIGVVFFSLACLFFALRGGVAGAVACAAFGLLAAGSQANGLFALPMAAAACALAGRRSRAALLGVVAIALWAAYFLHYKRPPAHPSVLAALGNPVGAMHLFTIVIGGLAPVGVAMLLAIAWLLGKGTWRAHPTAALWIAFILLSAAAATAGRIGFGVFYASRYAIYSTSLGVIVFLAICAATRPWRREWVAAAIAAAAATSLVISWLSWPRAMEYSRQGRLLGKVAATPTVPEARYVGMLYPSQELAVQFLEDAERRGLYTPPQRFFGRASLRTIAEIPAASRVAGFVDQVHIFGRRLHVVGWTDVPSSERERSFAVFPEGGVPLAGSAFALPRPDVAQVLRDRRLEYSGFALDIDFASEAEARQAAPMLCVVVEAPGHAVTVLSRTGVDCRPGKSR